MAIVINKDNDGNVVVTEDGVGRELFPNEETGGGNVDDVQINGTSILDDGVANIPVMSANDLGVAKIVTGYGLTIDSTNKNLKIDTANANQIKAGTSGYNPVSPLRQHESAFYGLAKASGDTTQSASANAVGTYTDDAKHSIRNMLGASGMIILDTATTADIYAKLSQLKQYETFTFFGVGTVMSLLTDGFIENTAKGIVSCTNATNGTYDFLVLWNANGIRSFRIAGPTAESVGTISNKLSYTGA